MIRNDKKVSGTLSYICIYWNMPRMSLAKCWFLTYDDMSMNMSSIEMRLYDYINGYYFLYTYTFAAIWPVIYMHVQVKYISFESRIQLHAPCCGLVYVIYPWFLSMRQWNWYQNHNKSNCEQSLCIFEDILQMYVHACAHIFEYEYLYVCIKWVGIITHLCNGLQCWY